MIIKLIPNWRESWKMWSVRLSAVGASIMSIFIYFPESSLFLYNAMPYEVKKLLPDNIALFIALIVFVGTAIARMVKQKKVKDA